MIVLHRLNHLNTLIKYLIVFLPPPLISLILTVNYSISKFFIGLIYGAMYGIYFVVTFRMFFKINPVLFSLFIFIFFSYILLILLFVQFHSWYLLQLVLLSTILWDYLSLELHLLLSLLFLTICSLIVLSLELFFFLLLQLILSLFYHAGKIGYSSLFGVLSILLDLYLTISLASTALKADSKKWYLFLLFLFILGKWKFSSLIIFNYLLSVCFFLFHFMRL